MRRVQVLVMVGLMVGVPAMAKPPQKAKKPAVVAATAPVAKPEELTLKRLVDGLRAAQVASVKAGENPDLTMQLLNVIAESSYVGVIHGHYALAGVGQAFAHSGMQTDEVRAYAKDMARNWGHMATVYADVARQKAFDVELKNIFAALAQLNERAAVAATALGVWTDAPDDTRKREAFTSALSDYQSRAKAFLSQSAK